MSKKNETSYGIIQPIIKHYEKCLFNHGISPKGLDWPNMTDLAKRFKIMLDVSHNRSENYSIIDLGCGVGFLLDYLLYNDLLKNIKEYIGVDISLEILHVARKRWPNHTFLNNNILTSVIPYKADYVLMNGVFTEKQTLTHKKMKEYMEDTLIKAFELANIGISFNVMSNFVDWKRQDLFHLSIDEITEFVSKNISRHFKIVHDYGLYEYFVYVYKDPIEFDMGDKWII